MKKIIKSTLSLVSAAALSATYAQAQVVYDLQDALAAGQPSLTNPTGVFSFGKYTAGLDPISFVLYSDFTEDLLGTGLDAFYTNPSIDPNGLYNDTGSTFSNFGIVLPAGEFAMGPDFGPSVVRFTAPVTGYYHVSSDFALVQSGHGGAFMYVYHNATQVAANTTQPTFSYVSATDFLLSAGDTIDFVVGGPGSGVDTTSLSATATFVAVPEPSVYALLGLGLVVVGVRLSRSRVAIS